jgi:hypothetical protein
MSDRSEEDLDADRCAVLPEQSAGELAAVVGDDVGTRKWHTSPRMNLTADLAGMVHTGSTFAHLVNLSMET